MTPPAASASSAEWPHAEIFREAWHRHRKYRQNQPLHLVVQLALSRDAEIDWARLEAVHPAWCQYWSHDWKYASLTLWEWIEAGMPAPPGMEPDPEPVPPPGSKTGWRPGR